MPGQGSVESVPSQNSFFCSDFSGQNLSHVANLWPPTVHLRKRRSMVLWICDQEVILVAYTVAHENHFERCLRFDLPDVRDVWNFFAEDARTRPGQRREIA